MIPPLSLFEDARVRIARHIVTTPMRQLKARTAARAVDVPVLDPRLETDLWLKLECLQASGSFKARGALSKVLSLGADVVQRGIVTASGGNHGLAVAYAGRAVSAPTVVYLPGRATAAKAARIEKWGAKVVRAGDVWDDAHAAALEHAAREGMAYVHPFADLAVVAGAGTIGLEVLEDVPDIDVVVVAIGGGGLASGVGAAVKQKKPDVRVIGVEPVGAPTLFESVRANAVVELATIETKATTLAPRKSDALNLGIIRDVVDEIVLVTDDEMREGARFLLEEIGIGAELSGAAAVAAVISGKAKKALAGAKTPCALVCGAGSDALP